MVRDISKFDFTTLYTKIYHNDLINVLNKIIYKAFTGGRGKYISFFGKKASWVTKPGNAQHFTKTSLKSAVKFLIEYCYFTVGNLLARQKIGIPMGIDPAPFSAYLYLYWYEDKFMCRLIRLDKRKAFLCNGNFWFIDDLIVINGGNVFLKCLRKYIQKIFNKSWNTQASELLSWILIS